MLSDRDVAIRFMALMELSPGEDMDAMIKHFDDRIDEWRDNPPVEECKLAAEEAYAMVPVVRKMFQDS